MTSFERDIGETYYKTRHVNATLLVLLKLGSLFEQYNPPKKLKISATDYKTCFNYVPFTWMLAVLRPYFNWLKICESVKGRNTAHLWCLTCIYSSSIWKTTFHGVLRGSTLLSTIWGLLICLACPSTSIAQSWYSENMKGNLFVFRKPGDCCTFHMLLTGNRSSFPYLPPSVPIALNLFTNKAKSTSPKHLMLELTCMQNTQYWMRCTEHYKVQKNAIGIMVSCSESDKLPGVWNV